MKPFLRDVKTFAIADYPEWTAYEAGFLVTKNSGWRSVRPVINNDKCTGCLQCYLYCPDGVIRETGDGGLGTDRVYRGASHRVYRGASQKRQSLIIDYDFCKGCGICKKICKVGAIEIINEGDAL